jgi:saccharopine dehydrogenase (NAD+, L-lysine-forming)
MGVVAVLGAAGTIGPAVVRDLAERRAVEHLLLIDRDPDALLAVAEAHTSGRATIRVLNAGDPAALAGALRVSGAEVLVNAASYRLNLAAMEGAVDAGCHYVDLGGLYHTTLRQLELDDRFALAGRTAVLGMGASPGKTNLMAALAASRLSRVDEIHVAVAATDPLPPGHTGLAAPYALDTILDELTLPALVLRDGSLATVDALTDGGKVLFPDPVGTRQAVYTLHSELATFRTSFPGIREISCRLSLAPALAERVEFLARCGLAGLDPVELADGGRVTPREVLVACLARSGATAPPSNQTTAVHLVEASGTAGDGSDGPATVRVAAVTVPHERWGIGGGVVATAAPAAEAAARLLRGDVPATGVLAPERAFAAEGFLDALAATGCTITVE